MKVTLMLYSKIWRSLIVKSHHFLLSLIQLFKKCKHWNLDIISYWVTGVGCYIKKNLEYSPCPATCSNDLLKFIALDQISINWPSFTSLVAVQKIYSKMDPVSCTNTHHYITGLLNYVMAKNIKTWISWKQYINFPRNQENINLCLRLTNFEKLYLFVAEVTFKV